MPVTLITEIFVSSIRLPSERKFNNPGSNNVVKAGHRA